jgi:uncharacterized membrane protein
MYEALNQFAGRLHPMIVHFPVGLLVCAALIELMMLARRRREVHVALPFCLGVGALFAWLAVGSGWLNAEYEGQNDGRVYWHRWLGVATAALGTLAYIVALAQRRFPGLRTTLRALVLLTGLAISIGGHQGGELTHGKGYLLEVFEQTSEPAAIEVVASKVAQEVVNEAQVPAQDERTRFFAERVLPIFAQRCIECHGPDKRKGRLRLDNEAEAFAPKRAGRSPRILAGDAQGSLLYQLICTDDEDDLMPSKGERLSAAQVEDVRLWIQEGAFWPPGLVISEETTITFTADPLSPDSPVILDSADVIEPAIDPLSPAFRKALESLRSQGAYMAPTAEGSADWELDCSMLSANSHAPDSAQLAAIGSNLVRLNLSRMQCGDDSLKPLLEWKRLQHLNLSQTKITDAGLSSLKQLDSLLSLNLYGTRITDAGLEDLALMPNLERVFLWQTDVTEVGLKRLASLRPALHIQATRQPLPTIPETDDLEKD